jgi:hypothetical protein
LVVAVTVGLPVVLAILHALAPELRAWICLLICAGAAASIVWLRYQFDRVSGLNEAMACTVTSRSTMTRSDLLTAGLLIAAEVSLFVGISAIMPGGGR